MGFFTTRIWIRAGILAAFAVAGMSAGQATAENDVPGTMLIGRRTSPPIGHYEFCQRMSSECRIWSDRRDPVQMSDAMWTLLGSVNTAVNRSIKALSDNKAYSKEEFWTFPDDGTGDCEDYVLLKRKMLYTHGIPLSNLLITVVRQKDGEGHAVLTVRTGDGDLILDNLNDDVKPWTQTGYRFMKRQSARYTGRWLSILDDRDVLVSSVN
ncbi:transglutaminase-like cysteine peptidase [Allomesorhizobium camelthorni]|uniref:Transglutaminase-like cysteine peptidase n=1 Tax=Allomesorhizobium camelthorni TaxID=475069 RepID=A0A6G4W824_9HYPH|nr:transglutaminase-like cysteine peptidase [Mesorhizobium camelthorni]NGO50396.1 transglutaminase-like cysteine peptidase [Mesorhizobium camelthorni]